MDSKAVREITVRFGAMKQAFYEKVDDIKFMFEDDK